MNVRGQGKGKGMRLTFHFINNNHRAEYRKTSKQILWQVSSLRHHSHKGLPLNSARRWEGAEGIRRCRAQQPAWLPTAWASCCLCGTQSSALSLRGVGWWVVGRLVSEAGLCDFGDSFDQGLPETTVSCDPCSKIAQSLLCICRQLCSGSEMPTPIKREVCNLCQTRIYILEVIFVFDSPASTSLERVAKIIVEGAVRTQEGFFSWIWTVSVKSSHKEWPEHEKLHVKEHTFAKLNMCSSD